MKDLPQVHCHLDDLILATTPEETHDELLKEVKRGLATAKACQ